MKWPIQLVLDSRRQQSGWAIVHAPVVSPHRQALLADLLRAGTRFVGMSSETTFPRSVSPDLIDYTALCEAWCHCFRAPQAFLPTSMPYIRLSLSDFTDSRSVITLCSSVRPRDVAFDFVYVTGEARWKRDAKGWDLACRCLPVLCGELGLRGLVVGAAGESVTQIAGLTWRPNYPRAQFLSSVSRAKFLFVPNGPDASPRVVAEAISLDVPVVMNKGILGGWHYVSDRTGVFFSDETDVASAVEVCTTQPSWDCRTWFDQHYGPIASGRRLLGLIRRIDHTLSDRSFLVPEGVDGFPVGS